MAVSKIANLNKIKGWAYLGSTTGDNGINIPDSYTDMFCFCYIGGDATKTVSFSEIINYHDERTYRSGYYSPGLYGLCSIHSYKNGIWKGWSAATNDGDKISTTQFFWYAR